jgi:hypothetical protein
MQFQYSETPRLEQTSGHRQQELLFLALHAQFKLRNKNWIDSSPFYGSGT